MILVVHLYLNYTAVYLNTLYYPGAFEDSIRARRWVSDTNIRMRWM